MSEALDEVSTTAVDFNERAARLKARKLQLQRQRRRGHHRIDYQPSAQALAAIQTLVRPYVGHDTSSVINRLVLKAIGIGPA